MSKKAKSLDQFYTNPDVANELFQIVISKISKPNRKVSPAIPVVKEAFERSARARITEITFEVLRDMSLTLFMANFKKAKQRDNTEEEQF